MNIYNLNDKVVVHIDELGEDIPVLDFAVYKYDFLNCLSSDISLSGPISQNSKTYMQLPDGKYSILVVDPAGNYVDMQQDFYVFYNTLPRLLYNIKKISCTEFCNNCTNSSLEDLFKVFFDITIFLNSTGVIDELPSYRYLSHKLSTTLNTSKDIECLYGKFDYNYSKSLLELFLMFIIELHDFNSLSNREVNEHIEVINNMFRVDEIKRCLNNSTLDLNYLDLLINHIKCNCNE